MLRPCTSRLTSSPEHPEVSVQNLQNTAELWKNSLHGDDSMSKQLICLSAGTCPPQPQEQCDQPTNVIFPVNPRTGPSRRFPGDILGCPSLGNRSNRSHRTSFHSSRRSHHPQTLRCDCWAPCTKGEVLGPQAAVFRRRGPG